MAVKFLSPEWADGPDGRAQRQRRPSMRPRPASSAKIQQIITGSDESALLDHVRRRHDRHGRRRPRGSRRDDHAELRDRRQARQERALGGHRLHDGQDQDRRQHGAAPRARRARSRICPPRWRRSRSSTRRPRRRARSSRSRSRAAVPVGIHHVGRRVRERTADPQHPAPAHDPPRSARPQVLHGQRDRDVRPPGGQLGPHREPRGRVRERRDHPAVQHALQVQVMRRGVEGDLDRARRGVEHRHARPAMERRSARAGPEGPPSYPPLRPSVVPPGHVVSQ